ncbi:MAG: hypothetical protein IJ880_17555 [Bacilli bacterium]|nr:hypothetical protein [Bacilli bacterium]
MNFSVIKAALYTAKNWTVKHSPEILLGTSIAAGVGATVTGCIAMTKMEAINQRHRETLDILHGKADDAIQDGEQIVTYKETPEYKKEITKEYGRYGIDIAKTWAPCVGLTLLSGTCALASFKIVNKRLIIAETAFASVSQAFEKYRDNVIEDQGEEKDQYYASNGDVKKKEKLIPESHHEMSINRVDNIFHYMFTKDSVKWANYSDYPYYNYRLLMQAQAMFDDRLQTDGFVLLDEVYTYLGLDTSALYAEKAQGRTYGWTLDGYAEDGMPNDNKVLFGILEYNDTQHRLFRAGQINDITLHFNCRLLTKETCELLAKG